MTRIWLRENKLQGLFRRERMRVYKTVTISKLLFKKKKESKKLMATKFSIPAALAVMLYFEKKIYIFIINLTYVHNSAN